MEAGFRMKRLFDVAGALGGLVFFGPVMAAVTCAVLLNDGGPIFFRQVRIGRARRPFVILKFRSMRDGRVTRVGRVLRATGLDELPQFINIVRGDLSAVGPRPLTEADIMRFGWTGADCDVRWSVRPGLIGPAQLVGPDSRRCSLRLDRRYIARRTFWLDVRLVAMAFLFNALGKARARRLLFGR
jgi:lipopolysaccharide/colanic/teichoic acid biosynthesis glycosyltransferase